MFEEAAVTHLVEPLPLVRDNDLDETGNDAGEINIAYNLWQRKREWEENKKREREDRDTEI